MCAGRFIFSETEHDILPFCNEKEGDNAVALVTNEKVTDEKRDCAV